MSLESAVAAVLELRRVIAEQADRIATLEAQLAAVTAQLPDGMQHCTIRFKECHKGHGWLTADNWVQYSCPTCELDSLRTALRQVAEAAKSNHVCQWIDDCGFPVRCNVCDALAIPSVQDVLEKATP